MSAYTDMQDQLKALKVAMQEAATEAIKTGLKELFDSMPEVIGIRWSQYTPYFNDGDPCRFGVHTIETTREGDGDEWSEHYWNEVEEFLNGFDKDDLEHVFGDGFMVTALKTDKGIEVSSEEHDHE